MAIEITLAIVGLILSALFSGSETAFISANPLQVQIWASQNKTGARRSLHYLENRETIMSIILAGNTFANILASSYSTIVLMHYDLLPLWALAIAVSFLILFFCELIPATFIQERANGASRFFAMTMIPVEIILLPLTLISRAFTAVFLRIIGSKRADFTAAITRDDLNQSVEQGHESGVIDEDEREYIRNVIEFSDTAAAEIKTPRTDIVALPASASIPEAKAAFQDSGFSKIIIYGESIDDIIGFIVLHDLFKKPEKLEDIMREIDLYPESKSTFELLKEFQEKNISIAALIDEFGGTSGIVTMEDLVEEIFGDFNDEYDEDAGLIRKLNNGDLVMNGRAHIDDLIDNFGLDIPEGDYETIAGYLLDKLDRFPERGEKIVIQNLEFHIIRATPKSIDYIRIHRLS
jgi:putative hemolysin